jgi:hypothetical protein
MNVSDTQIAHKHEHRIAPVNVNDAQSAHDTAARG